MMAEKNGNANNGRTNTQSSPVSRFNSIRIAATIILLPLIIWLSYQQNLLSPMFRPNRTRSSGAAKVLSENPLMFVEWQAMLRRRPEMLTTSSYWFRDGHNDLLFHLRMTNQYHIYNETFSKPFEQGGFNGNTDLSKIEAGQMGGAFWSAFVYCPSDGLDFSNENYAPIVRLTLEQIDLFNRLAEKYPKYFTLSHTAKEAEVNWNNGKLISPLIIEGLHQIGNSLATLRLYHQLGVRYATLTWNCHNLYADAAIVSIDGKSQASKPYHGGISKAGRDLILEMNRLGMIVDLSHTSDDTMRDILGGNPEKGWNGSLAPPIFSHSSARAICPHPRNVPDDILQLVKERNSLVMVNFLPDFVSCRDVGSPNGLPEFVPETSTLDQVVKHIMHIGELIGYDYVGIGSDYDGMGETPPAGLEDVSKYPDLINALLEKGVSEEDAGKIAGRNLLRVWHEVDKVAARLQKEINPIEDDLTIRFDEL